MVHWIVFLIIGVSFFVSSYNQGLFYDQHIYVWQVGMSILFLGYVLYLFFKKKETIPYLYLIVFLIPLCYLLSFTNAVTMQGAFDQFIQWMLFAMFFFVLVSLKKNMPSIQTGMLVLLQLFGLFIAFLPFLTSWEWLEYNDAILSRRFSSVFQYPNTYAAVTMALLLFNIMYMSIKRHSALSIILFSLPVVLYASTLFLSLSRGAMILLPIIWFVGLCCLSFVGQVKYILYTMIAFVGGFVFFMFFSNEWGTFETTGQIIALLLVSLLSTALVFVIHQGLNVKANLTLSNKKLRYIFPIASFVGGVALVLDFVYKGVIYNLLPENVQNRINNIGYETIFEDGRLTFFFDALDMFKNAPIIGWGGDGWSILYHDYQTEPYVSNEVHSVLLEQLLNIGLLGFVVWIGVLVLFVVVSIKAFKQSADGIVPAGLIALMMLLGHGAIDFDFSFASIWLLFFLIFAMVVPGQPEFPTFSMEKYKRPAAIGASVLATVLVIISSIYAFRFEAAQRTAQANTQSSNKEEVLEGLSEARDLNPYRLDYVVNQASTAVELRNEDLTLELSNQFTNVQPLSGTAWMQSGNSYASFGYIDEAVKRYKQALEYDPFNTGIYERMIRLTSGEAASLKQNGKDEEASNVADQATETYEQYTNTTLEFRQNPESNYKDLDLNKSSRFLAGQAYMINEEYDSGIEVLNTIGKAEEDIYLRAQALVIHALEKQGKDEQSKKKYNQLKNQNDKATSYYEAYTPFFK
ncbi:tetratricopeptide (TPR) repeat protein [Salibacterium salarium]|uniref:O-antigen ligase family protein n=1 Tax=Salibacterium salarium TaxID=284579 RepID=UPI00277E3593|nr:O-antigen ligase family protein [Salibacterium salarium]MDQ0297876.1 tetratricopeptide (TPR) repeat protein [Salibacterium salarium]